MMNDGPLEGERGACWESGISLCRQRDTDWPVLIKAILRANVVPANAPGTWHCETEVLLETLCNVPMILWLKKAQGVKLSIRENWKSPTPSRWDFQN